MISGFTLVRNGVKFDYPFVESIQSLLPWVDELVVNVGIGEDKTLEVVQDLASKSLGKLRYFESHWPLEDPEKKKSGLILSEQTNLALDACKGDWCVYLQADEVLHDDDRPAFLQTLKRVQQRHDIQALVFDYEHFYGSYDFVQKTRGAYRREVRAVKKSSGIRSIGDAQSFRLADGAKPSALHCGARIFHYGWVRTPEAMKEKTFFMDQLYHGDPTEEAKRTGTPYTGDNYRYKKIWGLARFRATHPSVMSKRIVEKNWKWDLAGSSVEWSWRDLKKIVLDSFERVTGKRLFEYRSYRLVR